MTATYRVAQYMQELRIRDVNIRIREMAVLKIKDRVKELRRVRASELVPNPRNWRRHPQVQRDAMGSVLADIGFADALLVRETPEGLQLIDGHLRADLTGDALVPVLVLDVTEAEADKLLATLDPLAGMAEPDAEALRDLLASLESSSDSVNALLDSLAQEVAPWEPDIQQVESIDPTDEPITATLRIRCPTAIIDQLRPALQELLQSYPEAELV